MFSNSVRSKRSFFQSPEASHLDSQEAQNFQNTLDTFFALLTQTSLTPLKLAAFIQSLAEFYSTDETFKNLLPQNDGLLLLRHSLYEMATALGDENAPKRLKALREEKESSEILATNLRNRAPQHSFSNFLTYLKSKVGEEAEEKFLDHLQTQGLFSAASKTELRSGLEQLSKSYMQSRKLRELTQHYPAYRLWIASQVDEETRQHELQKLADKNPVFYLKDFLEGHYVELLSDFAEESHKNSIQSQFLLMLSKITVNSPLSLGVKAGQVFTQAAAVLTERSPKKFKSELSPC
jgi:hypothetical protein